MSIELPIRKIVRANRNRGDKIDGHISAIHI